MKAKFIRDMDDSWTAEAALYRLSDYVDHEGGFIGKATEAGQTNYVVVSAIPYAFDHHDSEVLVFPADEKGHILDYGELAGLRGTMNHTKALAELGETLEP